jgi:hypothetical protein
MRAEEKQDDQGKDEHIETHEDEEIWDDLYHLYNDSHDKYSEE